MKFLAKHFFLTKESIRSANNSVSNNVDLGKFEFQTSHNFIEKMIQDIFVRSFCQGWNTYKYEQNG